MFEYLDRKLATQVLLNVDFFVSKLEALSEVD